MHEKRSHIGLFMFMVYFLSFTLHAMPSMILGEVQIKKECPNKKKSLSSEIKPFTQIHGQFERFADDENQEKEKPLEVSICPVLSALILNVYEIDFTSKVREISNVIYSPFPYISPILENIHKPPQLA